MTTMYLLFKDLANADNIHVTDEQILASKPFCINFNMIPNLDIKTFSNYSRIR